MSVRSTLRSLRNRLRGVPGGARRAAVRALYRFPLLSAKDPRKRIVRFKDYCGRTVSLPPTTEPATGSWYLAIRSEERIIRMESRGITSEQTAAFAAGVDRYQGGPAVTIPEVFLASIEHAIVISGDFLVLSHERHIFFESALSRRDYLEASGILDTVFPPRPKRLAGEYALLANRSNRGYYHWLIDVLPKLSLLEGLPGYSGLPLIVQSELNPFHKESLQLLGIDDARLVPLAPGAFQVDRLVFPEILGPTGIPSPHAVNWLRQRLLPATAELPSRARRRIYLSRRDATQRRVINEAEIIEFLSPFGFEVVCAGELSLREQIALFQGVEIVIGPHGAGFTNMLFASPGALMIELFGENYINGCFWALANICQQRHGYVIGPATWLDFRIEKSDLEVLLRNKNVI